MKKIFLTISLLGMLFIVGCGKTEEIEKWEREQKKSKTVDPFSEYEWVELSRLSRYASSYVGKKLMATCYVSDVMKSGDSWLLDVLSSDMRFSSRCFFEVPVKTAPSFNDDFIDWDLKGRGVVITLFFVVKKHRMPGYYGDVKRVIFKRAIGSKVGDP